MHVLIFHYGISLIWYDREPILFIVTDGPSPLSCKLCSVNYFKYKTVFPSSAYIHIQRGTFTSVVPILSIFYFILSCISDHSWCMSVMQVKICPSEGFSSEVKGIMNRIFIPEKGFGKTKSQMLINWSFLKQSRSCITGNVLPTHIHCLLQCHCNVLIFMHHVCTSGCLKVTCNLCFILRPWSLVVVSKPLNQRPPSWVTDLWGMFLLSLILFLWWAFTCLIHKWFPDSLIYQSLCMDPYLKEPSHLLSYTNFWLK